MRLQYMECKCCDQCMLKYRNKICQESGYIELSRSFQPECSQKDDSLLDKAKIENPRGINAYVQKLIILACVSIFMIFKNIKSKTLKQQQITSNKATLHIKTFIQFIKTCILYYFYFFFFNSYLVCISLYLY